ncbi:MAG: YihY/virulence factor BrkB family protein [Acidobacteria bacterium]|nr:YihY/virulence factor BrkB family protein [Acidobacteriota bacterium]
MRSSQSVIRWGEILKRTGRAIYEGDCLGWAAELAFFWFLALFPALLFVVALAGSLPVQQLIDEVVGNLARVAPDDVLILVREQLVQIANGPPSGLLTLSLLGALWSSSSAMTAIIDTLNHAYHVREGRAWWRVRLLAVGLTVVLVAFTLIAVSLVMIGPMLAEYLDNSVSVPRRFAWMWAIVEWPLVFGLIVTALGWVYYFAPDVRRRWAWITPGSIVATLLWMLASLGFKWYAGHFGEYQKTYGAIGGVIVALLWLYASGLAILIGAELNAAIEHAAAERQAPGNTIAGEPAGPGALGQ